MEMTQKVYKICLCGRTIRYEFNYPDTHTYFGKYLTESDNDPYDIKVSEEFITASRWLIDGACSNDLLEFHSLMLATGNYLLQYKSALFHGASFVWKGLAWIITAPSGTGKTTQLVNWMDLYMDTTAIINGDKTGLECRSDGSVFAYSSPWRGKEMYGFRNRVAKLGGIVVLEQGSVDSLVRLGPSGAVYPLFIEFISCPETERQIQDQRNILEQMIDEVPVWKFVNTGDEASTVILHDTLEEYLVRSR